MSELVVIGITGGVGAGKSTVLKYLKEKYMSILLEADSIGRMLMMPGGETYDTIIETFGEGVKREDGTIDNLKVAEIVFKGQGNTVSINEIVHPAVVIFMKDRIDRERLESYIDPSESLHIIVIEAAILFEGKADHLCDDIWYVRVPEETRIERLMASRGYSLEKCRNIMNNQMSDEEFIEKCDYTLDNTGDITDIYSRIDERIKELERRFLR